MFRKPHRQRFENRAARRGRAGLLAIALASALAISAVPSASHAQTTLSVATWGGAYGQSQEIAFFEPFAKETGTVIATEIYDGSLAKLKAMIDGSGTPRRAFLATFPLKAELTRIAAPKREEQAFLIAKAMNESGPVLLAGPVNIFLGDEFTGKTHLPTIPPGDDFKLAFGPDDRVKVERKIIERKHETTGVFSKEELYRYGIRTTVKNLYPTPITATILDQVPVSRDETIKVTILVGSTKPTEPEDPMKPGVRSYTFTLQPKAEQIIELGYEVRFPKGQMIGGLE